MDGNLAAAVKAARLDAGLSARELARAAALSHSYISQLESGVICAPSPGVLKRLADVLSGLNYWKLLVLAGYISRTDELGGSPGDDGCEEGGFTRGVGGAEKAGLAPVRDPKFAERLISALTGGARDLGKSVAGMQDSAGNGAGLALERLPVLGMVPAGEMQVESCGGADALESVEKPAEVRGAGPFAALIVRGDSMTGAGILDGDTVIIDRGAAARDGDAGGLEIIGRVVHLKRNF